MSAFSHIDAIILAAGKSSRFKPGNKLLKTLGGLSLIEWVVKKACTREFRSVIVVTGHDRERIEAAVADYDVKCIFNPQYDAGMGASIVVGVKDLSGAESYLIWPADMPLIQIETVEAVCNALKPARIIAPTHKNKRGHPVLFASTFLPDLMAIPFDTGARSIIQNYPESIHLIEVDDPAILCDIDTREQLNACLDSANNGIRPAD